METKNGLPTLVQPVDNSFNMINSVLTSTLHAISIPGDGKIDVFLTVFAKERTAKATIV